MIKNAELPKPDWVCLFCCHKLICVCLFLCGGINSLVYSPRQSFLLTGFCDEIYKVLMRIQIVLATNKKKKSKFSPL